MTPPEAELPPGLVEKLQAQAGQMREQQQKFQILEARLQVEERKRVLQWSMIFCTCVIPYSEIPWTGQEQPEPCVVHNAAQFHFETGKMVTWP